MTEIIEKDTIEKTIDAIDDDVFSPKSNETTIDIISLVDMDMNVLCLSFNLIDKTALLLKRIYACQRKWGASKNEYAILKMIEEHFNTLLKHKRYLMNTLELKEEKVLTYTYLSSVKEHNSNYFQLLYSNLFVDKSDAFYKYEMNPMFMICNEKLTAYDNVLLYRQNESSGENDK